MGPWHFFGRAAAIAMIPALWLSATPAQAQFAPYCPVRMIWVPYNPQMASASFDQMGPVIYMGGQLQQYGPDFTRFVAAHECAHHIRGHLQMYMQGFMGNPYYNAWMTPRLELDADCTAAQILAARGDYSAIRSAAQIAAAASGPYPSGPNYPTGFQRAATIMRCGGLN